MKNFAQFMKWVNKGIVENGGLSQDFTLTIGVTVKPNPFENDGTNWECRFKFCETRQSRIIADVPAGQNRQFSISQTLSNTQGLDIKAFALLMQTYVCALYAFFGKDMQVQVAFFEPTEGIHLDYLLTFVEIPCK